MKISTMARVGEGEQIRRGLMPLAVVATVALVSLWGCARPAVAPTPADTGSPTAGGATISHGQRISLADHAVPGKTTIFDFYSDYCPPCRAISPRLEELARRRDDIAVVKVDINRPGVRRIDWESPVAQQYSLQSIPHFIICGPNRQVTAEGAEAYGRVQEWLGR